ncbi:MAG: RnfABCDGE type electron transport complex subunit D [Clostridia bacterium]|nr:RnfABCDGE type electron transport complex subunit D [Clostridia bacterium]
MDIRFKIFPFLKSFWSGFKSFFLKEDKATRTELKGLDLADIFISLAPLAIFGCLLFGLRAVLVLLTCVLIPVILDFLWELIFKKEKKGVNWSITLSGLILGLTVSSRLNIFLVIATSVLLWTLRKFVLKGSYLQLVFSVLIVRIVFGAIFYNAFKIYNFPFINTQAQMLPFDYIFSATSFVYPAKYLFFGLHSGNIGETSVLLLLVGGIYLMLRKIINPIIPCGFLVSVAALSLIFGRSITISLLGGSLFFGLFIMAIDYSFITTPRYKKILFGIVCGALTFGLRELLKTEAVGIAVLITYVAFMYINIKNIKIVFSFFKNLNYKGFVNKIMAKFKQREKE